MKIEAEKTGINMQTIHSHLNICTEKALPLKTKISYLHKRIVVLLARAHFHLIYSPRAFIYACSYTRPYTFRRNFLKKKKEKTREERFFLRQIPGDWTEIYVGLAGVVFLATWAEVIRISSTPHARHYEPLYACIYLYAHRYMWCFYSIRIERKRYEKPL